MYKLDQNQAPIHQALQKFRQMRVVPFDVPGHKRGRGNPELARLLAGWTDFLNPGPALSRAGGLMASARACAVSDAPK